MVHDVIFNIPSRSLGKSDIEFEVKTDGETLGTLKISKGSLVWFPKGNIYGHKIQWKQFDKYMQDRPKIEKR